jgi:hypothetical protein
VVQNGLVLSGHLQQPHQRENPLPIQEFLLETAGKPQTLGSGAKDFQRNWACGSYWRKCAGDYRVVSWKIVLVDLELPVGYTSSITKGINNGKYKNCYLN